MLIETPNIRQHDNEDYRRLFSCDDMELYFWTDTNGVVSCFQLSYDVQRFCRTIGWSKQSGYTHSRVDDGRCADSWHVTSTILLPCLHFDKQAVGNAFAQAIENSAIEASIADFILQKIQTCCLFVCPSKQASRPNNI